MTTEVVSGACLRFSTASRKFDGMKSKLTGTESITTEKVGTKDDSTKAFAISSLKPYSCQVDSQTAASWPPG